MLKLKIKGQIQHMYQSFKKFKSK